MVVEGLLLGAGIGLGVVMIWRGLWPTRPSMQAVVAQLTSPTPTTSSATTTGRGPRRWVARRAGSLGPFAIGDVGRLQRDLVVTQHRLEDFAFQRVVCAAAFAVAPVGVGVGLTVGGIDVPAVPVVIVAVALGAGGYLLPAKLVRDEADRRRRELTLTHSAYLRLVAVQMSGGAGVMTALRVGAQMGDGWAFHYLAERLERAQAVGQSPWVALGAIGEELGVAAFEETAAAMNLAGVKGARVADTLMARADALLEHELADERTRAERRSEHLALPVVLMMGGTVLLIMYPAMARVVGL